MFAGFLLHSTCCKRRNRFFLSGACFYFCYFKLFIFDAFQYCISIYFIRKFDFFIALTVEFRFENLTCFVCQFRTKCPVFFGNEISDFFFSVTNQSQGYRLHTAAAETFLYFFPEQVTDCITNHSVQHTACLLGIYQIHINISGFCDGFFHSRFCDFIESDTADIFFFFQIECVKQMPADGFPFTVRVSCEIYFVSSLRIFTKFAQKFPLPADRNIFGFKVIFKIDTQLAFRQVTDMTHRSLNLIVAAQEFADRSRFCRRFYNHQIFFPCFLGSCFFCCFLGSCFFLFCCCSCHYFHLCF